MDCLCGTLFESNIVCYAWELLPNRLLISVVIVVSLDFTLVLKTISDKKS
jgi:hypothetical protein